VSGCRLEGDKVLDMKSVAVEGHVAALRAGQEADTPEAEGVKDLCAESVAAKVHADWLKGAGVIGSRDPRGDLKPGAAVRHVDERATPFLGDAGKGEVDGALFGTILAAEDIVEDIFGLDPDKGRVFVELTHCQGKMDTVIGQRSEKMQGPFAMRVPERLGKDRLNQFLAAVAVLDQLFDGNQFKRKAFPEFPQFREAGHGTVFIEDFAQDTGWREAGENGQVNRGFRVAGALKNASGTCPKRKNMSGLNELVGRGGRIGKEADGRATVGRADPCRDPFCGIDRDGEIRPVAFAVIGDHWIETEAFELVLHGRHADKSSSVPDHHVDGFRGGGRCRHDEVALVLAVLIIHYDYKLS